MNRLTTTGKNPRNTAKKPKDTTKDTTGEYQAPESIEAVQELLRDQVYISDRALAVPIFLAMKLQRPLFLEGEAGVGKTAIVEGFAQRVVNGDIPELLADKRIVVLDLAMIGVFGGFYIVPLYAIIQIRSAPRHRARVIATISAWPLAITASA